MRDLRDVKKRPFPDLLTMLRISGHPPPAGQLQNRPNAMGPAYDELVIPERLRNFAVSLGGVGTPLKPKQEMANYISLKLARGQAKFPAYTPTSFLMFRPPIGLSLRRNAKRRLLDGARVLGRQRVILRLFRCRRGFSTI